jgi:hypothetical protein
VKKLDKKIKKEGSVLKIFDKYSIKAFRKNFIVYGQLKSSGKITESEHKFFIFI